MLKAKETLAKIAEQQRKKDFSGKPFVCPRCGALMRPDMATNSLSRHESVYVCNMCGADEAILDYAGSVLPLTKWAFYRDSCGNTACKDFFTRLYYLKKTILFMESKTGNLDGSNKVFDDFMEMQENQAGEELLYQQIISLDAILRQKLKEMGFLKTAAELDAMDYEEFTRDLHGRSYWNEIPNDKAVQHFFDAFGALKGLDRQGD